MDTIGSRLKKAREVKGVTQAELESILKIPRKSLSLYESDKRLPPTEALLKLSDYYNISIDWILGRVDNEVDILVENLITAKYGHDIVIILEMYGKMSTKEKKEMLYIFKTHFENNYPENRRYKNQEKDYDEMKKEEIIHNYIKLCYELEKVASTSDVRKCSYICSPDRIISTFGSWINFLDETGICKNGESVGMPLKEVVEATLLSKRLKLGRRLDYMEFNDKNNLPGANYVRRLYQGIKMGEIWDEIEYKYNIKK